MPQPNSTPFIVTIGGSPVTVMSGPLAGGIIVNPRSAADQGIGVVEPLYVDIVSPSVIGATITNVPVQPGSAFFVPPLAIGSLVSVNAATSGHAFSSIVILTPQPQPVPQIGNFPPSGPTTLTVLIPAYVYQQYQDDDAIQAWFAALNALQQSYVSWFATIGLPVYTGAQINDDLLDLVAAGIYGMFRPPLSSGQNRYLGPLNTYQLNTLAFNQRKLIGPANITVTSDDLFKRIMTWNFYKGDGNTFNVRWLKRRVMRFLTGEDGTAPNIDNTYPVSVSLGPPNQISILLAAGTRVVTGGSLFNRFGFNQAGIPFNTLLTHFTSAPNPPQFSKEFKEAMDSGVMIMPFQYQVTVVV